MTESEKLSLEVLRFFRDWQADPDSPDGAVPVLFPDTIIHFDGLNSKDIEVRERNSRKLEAKFEELHDREMISGKKYKNGWAPQKLSAKGYDHLENLEAKLDEGTFLAKTGRTIFAVVEKFIIPILVTVIAAIVIAWFIV